VYLLGLNDKKVQKKNIRFNPLLAREQAEKARGIHRERFRDCAPQINSDMGPTIIHQFVGRVEATKPDFIFFTAAPSQLNTCTTAMACASPKSKTAGLEG
jgi:hypothetical protein